MTWDFHCFSSAKIAIPGRPSLRIPLLGRPTPGIGTLIANDALPHGGGKFPGSETTPGNPFPRVQNPWREPALCCKHNLQNANGGGGIRRGTHELLVEGCRAGYTSRMPYKDPEKERERQRLRKRIRTPEQKARRAEWNRRWRSHRHGNQGRLRATRECPDKCEVCGNPPGPGRRLDFDHCHLTERFRGWLCNPCNMALGCAKDQSARLRRLADYLDNFYGIASRS